MNGRMKTYAKIILGIVLIEIFPIFGIILLVFWLSGSSLRGSFSKGWNVVKYVGVTLFSVILLTFLVGLSSMIEEDKKEAQTEIVPSTNEKTSEEPRSNNTPDNTLAEVDAISYEEGDYGLLGNDEIEIEYNLKKKKVITKESKLRNNTYDPCVGYSSESEKTRSTSRATTRSSSSNRTMRTTSVARSSSPVRGK